MPDWKKEIHLSDLFRRKGGEKRPPATFGVAPPPPGQTSPGPSEPATSVWKKEISLFGRKSKKQAEPQHVPPPHLTVVPPPPPDLDPPVPTPAGAPRPTANWPEPAAHEPAEPTPVPVSPVVVGDVPPPPVFGEATPPPPTYGDVPPPPPPPSWEDEPAPAAAGDPQPWLGAPVEPVAHEVPVAPAAEAPEVDAPAPPAQLEEQEALAAAAMTQTGAEHKQSVWKREMRASDLFRKRGRPEGPPAARTGVPAKGGLPSEDAASVWKKEIRASDLFRRREKAPKVPGDAFSGGGDAAPVSFWKKEVKLSEVLRPQSGAADTATVAEPAQKRKSSGEPFWKRELGGGQGRGKSTPMAPLPVPLLRAVNLLPSDPQSQKKPSKVSPANLGVGVAAVVVIAALAFGYLTTSGTVEEKLESKQRLEAAIVAAEAPPAPAPGTPATPVGGDVELAAEQTARVSALSAAIGQRVAWDRVLRQVSVVMPAGTWLRGLAGSGAAGASPSAQTAAAPGTVTLTGFSQTREGVARLLARLQTVPDLASVQLVAATTVTIGDEDVVDFSIVGTLRTPADAAAEVSNQ